MRDCSWGTGLGAPLGLMRTQALVPVLELMSPLSVGLVQALS